MDSTNLILDSLQKEDFYRGFLQLLEQLTVVEIDKISYENFCKQFDQLQSKVIVIRDKNKNNKVIATASIFIEKKFIHNLSSVGHIEDVVVDKEVRGKNLGKILIEELVRISKLNFCYKILLDCQKNNVDFYEKCGFSQKGVEMSYYLPSRL